MSSSDTTLYYSAMDEMFKDLILDTTESEKQVDTMENEAPLVETPKRPVRIRQHNLFAKDKKEFIICRRMPISWPKLNLSPSRKDQQGKELLRLRRERCEGEEKKPMRRLSIRI